MEGRQADESPWSQVVNAADQHTILEPEDDTSEETRRRRLGHELRSTAQGLLGYLSIFQEEIQSKLDTDDAQLVERIGFYAKKLADLSMELLSEIQSTSQK